MKTFLVTILEHETSRPLQGLLATWYLTAERNVPDGYLDPSKWTELKKGGWAELNPSRIGSGVTSQNACACLLEDVELETREAGRRFSCVQAVNPLLTGRGSRTAGSSA